MILNALPYILIIAMPLIALVILVWIVVKKDDHGAEDWHDDLGGWPW